MATRTTNDAPDMETFMDWLDRNPSEKAAFKDGLIACGLAPAASPVLGDTEKEAAHVQ